MLINQSKAQLLLIDMQERLLPAMAAAERVLKHAIILAKAARTLDLPISISEQYPKGLGHTVAPLKDEIGNAPVDEKIEFSCWKNAALRDRITQNKREQVIVAGIETHVCALQTAMDLKEAGYQVFVVADAMSSRVEPSAELAFARMQQAGIAIVTTEMVVFEALGAAGTPEFKQLSALIR
ncbi:MAG: hydrolase [Hyphomicrobiales bacterium]